MHIIAFDGFLSVKWSDYYYMLNGRFNGFNGFLSVKWSDYYYMSNGVIQWIFKCQIGRLFSYVKWDNSMNFFSVK